MRQEDDFKPLLILAYLMTVAYLFGMFLVNVGAI